MQTNAMLIDEQNRSVTFGQIDLPDPIPAGHVVVETKWVGICRSDTELLDGDFDSWVDVAYPIVPGHEWSGLVHEVGPDVTRFTVGDRVVGECVTGHMAWFGLTYNGAGSSHFMVLERLLHAVPPSIDDRAAAMVEPFTVAYRALGEVGGIDGADVVAVVGGGMIGQCAALAATATGARTFVVEPSESRRRLAERLGVHGTIDPARGDPAEALREASGTPGASVIIEASGNARGMASCFDIAAEGATVVQVGVCAEAEVTAPLALIQAKNLTIKGITGSSGVWPRALRFLQRHDIDLNPLASHEFAFEDGAAAFELSRDASAVLKVLLKP